MKAYSYIRWSSDTQTQGDSLKRQLEMTRKICAEKGWQLDESLRPAKGISAFTGDNITKGSLATFLAQIESGAIQTPCGLVVEALDRLTRAKLTVARKLFEGLLEKGVKICTAHNGKVYDENSLEDPFALFMSIMELKAANDYSANIGRRLSAAWGRKKHEDAQAGKLITRAVPAWIQIGDDGKLSVIEEKAKVIRRIFREYLANKGAMLIAYNLDSEEVPNFGRGGGWATTTIKRYLTSVAVIGNYQPKKYVGKFKKIDDGPEVENYFPAIVDKLTFYKVQERMKERRTTRGARKTLLNLFSGLVYCKHCGGKMTLKTGGFDKLGRHKPQIALVCAQAKAGRGCQYKTISLRPIERVLLSTLWYRIVSNHVPMDNSNVELENLQGELKQRQVALEKLRNQMESGDISDTAVKVSTRLEKRIKELEIQISLVPVKTDNDPIQNWRKVPNTRENRIYLQGVLTNVIERVSIDAQNNKAVLELRGNLEKVRLAWDDRRDKEGYMFNGQRHAYLDHTLIWENPSVLVNDVPIIPETKAFDPNKPFCHAPISPKVLAPQEHIPLEFIVKRQARLNCLV